MKKYELSRKDLLPYFLNHIKCGKFLSQEVCRLIDFEKGRFFTVLPENIDQKKLLDFEHGGIIPSESNNPRIVKTMDQACSGFIADFLCKGPDKLAVIENYMLTPDSPFTIIPNVKMVPFHEDVYYFLTKQNSTEDIYTTLRKSSLVWHFLAILTRSNALELSPPVISDLCHKAEIIIGGAYDGEGYVFWEKEK